MKLNKFLIFQTLYLYILLNLISIALATQLTTQLSTHISNSMMFQTQLAITAQAKSEIELKFRNKALPSTHTLVNPLRLFKIESEHKVLARLRFMWGSKEGEISKFTYKSFNINKDDIIIYKSDQMIKEIDPKSMETVNYLMTIKVSNIELPCNGFSYVCNYNEMLKEYQKKLKGVNFKLPEAVEKEVSSKLAGDLCIIITLGPFKNTQEVGFICADTKEDAIFYQSLIYFGILNY